MKKHFAKIAIVSALAVSFHAFAGVDEVKAKIEANANIKVEKITESEMPGIYELYSQGSVVYTDSTGKLLMIGQLIDPAAKRNITEERLSKLNAIDVSKLPVNQAVKITKGSGKRVLYTFEDPNCGYCKKLAPELQKLEDVTIYTFPTPILSEDSFNKSKQVFCAKDSAKAWSDLMLNGKSPENDGSCKAAENADANRKLAQQLGVRGTPTIFFKDGSRAPGAIPANKIDERLGKK